MIKMTQADRAHVNPQMNLSSHNMMQGVSSTKAKKHTSGVGAPYQAISNSQYIGATNSSYSNRDDAGFLNKLSNQQAKELQLYQQNKSMADM